MPIRKEMKSKYPPPKEWQKIRAEVLARAGNKCEWEDEHGLCRVPDRALIYWDGECWIALESTANVPASAMSKYVRIILTTAHLDQNPENNGEPGHRPNLKALCQRHHNRLDAPHRARGIRQRRQEKAEAARAWALREAENVQPEELEAASELFDRIVGKK